MQTNNAKNKARVLFVDDEKRVLNSMRGMFRRDFDLFLTTEGAAAVKIAAETPIDVIVADQRMPGMTGIEVLGKVKEFSPDTIRILLTGYADPSAVEGSINVGEVFRFLGKPCPPKVLRDTLELAVTATRSAKSAANPAADVLADDHRTPHPPKNAATGAQSATAQARLPRRSAPDAASANGAGLGSETPEIRRTGTPAKRDESGNGLLSRLTSIGEVAFAWDSYERRRDGAGNAQPEVSGRDVGIVLYTVDSLFAESALRTLSATRSTTLATSLIKVMRAIEHHRCGILVTDISGNSARLQRIISALKQVRPELVTIAVSDTRDTTEMVELINHGQIFRYIQKPVSPERLKAAVEDASAKSIELQDSPGAVRRHAVAAPLPGPSAADTLSQVLRGTE